MSLQSRSSKHEIELDLRRAAIDVLQAGNYVAWGKRDKAIANINAGIMALGKLRDELKK